jgi:hypothetical protein
LGGNVPDLVAYLIVALCMQLIRDLPAHTLAWYVVRKTGDPASVKHLVAFERALRFRMPSRS